MATRLEVDLRNFGVAWTTATTYTVDVNAGLVVEVGNNRTPSPAVAPANTFTTFASTPILSSVTPSNNSTGTFNQNIKLTFNRPIFAESGKNLYIYKDSSPDTLFQTIPITSSSVSISSNTCTVVLTGFTWTNATYYITSDVGVVSDSFNFNYAGILDDTILKFEQSVISNMVNRSYQQNSKNYLFSSNPPVILDVDNSTSTQYTINFSSTTTEFSLNADGSDVTTNWTFTGTKSQCNTKLSTLIVWPIKDSLSEIFTYTQIKNGITQISKVINLTGTSYEFPTTWLTYINSEIFDNQTFTNYTWTPDYETIKYAKMDVLIVGGGGGGGGYGGTQRGGGGGGGVIVLNNQTIQNKTYNLTVGYCGISRNLFPYYSSGRESTFDGNVAYGGGGGQGGQSGAPTTHNPGGTGTFGGGGAGGDASGINGGAGFNANLGSIPLPNYESITGAVWGPGGPAEGGTGSGGYQHTGAGGPYLSYGKHGYVAIKLRN